MKNVLVISVLLASMLFVTNAFCFSISQNSTEIKKGKTHIIVVKNIYDKPITIKFSTKPQLKETIIAIAKNSKLDPEKYLKMLTETPDCTDAIKVFPKLITVAPGKEQSFKMISTKAGYCRLVFKITYATADATPADADNKNISLGVSMLPDASFPVAVDVPHIGNIMRDDALKNGVSNASK